MVWTVEQRLIQLQSPSEFCSSNIIGVSSDSFKGATMICIRSFDLDDGSRGGTGPIPVVPSGWHEQEHEPFAIYLPRFC